MYINGFHLVKDVNQNLPLPYATLFQVQINPKWGQHIVNCLQNQQKFPKTISKQRRKAIEIEALDFTLIGNQLYKKGLDHQLRLCANEKRSIFQS